MKSTDKEHTLEDVLRRYACDFADSSGPGYDEEITHKYADEIRELLDCNKKTIYDWLYFAFALEHNDLFFEFIDKLSNDSLAERR